MVQRWSLGLMRLCADDIGVFLRRAADVDAFTQRFADLGRFLALRLNGRKCKVVPLTDRSSPQHLRPVAHLPQREWAPMV